ELGIEGLAEGGRGEFGHPAAALRREGGAALERAPVEALDVLHALLEEQGAEQAAREVRREVLGVCIHEAHQVALEDGERPPHRVTLAQDRSELRQQPILLVHLGSMLGRNPGGVIRGGPVDHHHLVDRPALSELGEDPDRRADRRRLVQGGHADRDARPPLGESLGWELAVVEGPHSTSMWRTGGSKRSWASSTRPSSSQFCSPPAWVNRTISSAGKVWSASWIARSGSDSPVSPAASIPSSSRRSTVSSSTCSARSIPGSGSERIMRRLEVSAGATTSTSAVDASGSPSALFSASADTGSETRARTFLAIAGLIPVSGQGPPGEANREEQLEGREG